MQALIASHSSTGGFPAYPDLQLQLAVFIIGIILQTEFEPHVDIGSSQGGSEVTATYHKFV